jgi:DNA-binding MarR family transcriptional regulator
MAAGKPDLQETARQLNSGAVRVLRGLRLVDRRSGLTPARLSALSVLVFGGPCTLGRLAELEDVAGPTMTRIVDGLCRDELAQRTPHPQSGRAVLISATPTGNDLMRVAADRRVDALVEAMSRLDEIAQAHLRSAAPALVQLADLVRQASHDATVAGG